MSSRLGRDFNSAGNWRFSAILFLKKPILHCVFDQLRRNTSKTWFQSACADLHVEKKSYQVATKEKHHPTCLFVFANERKVSEVWRIGLLATQIEIPADSAAPDAGDAQRRCRGQKRQGQLDAGRAGLVDAVVVAAAARRRPPTARRQFRFDAEQPPRLQSRRFRR